MQRASDLFNDEQRKRIEEAVVEAEAKTSCEIVPVVATASGRYDRPEDIIGLWMAIFAAITVWLMFPRLSNESGSWDGMPIYVGLLAMVAGVNSRRVRPRKAIFAEPCSAQQMADLEQRAQLKYGLVDIPIDRNLPGLVQRCVDRGKGVANGCQCRCYHKSA